MNKRPVDETLTPPPPIKRRRTDEITRRMYDIIEEDRCTLDVIYCFTKYDKPDVRFNYLNNLVNVIMATYGKREIACPSNPQGVNGLTESDRSLLERIADVNQKKEYFQISLFFVSFYLLPSFLKYFTSGNIEKSEPPPPMADSAMFDFFVRTCLSERCEDMFNGRLSNVQDSLSPFADPITIFVETVMNDYFKTCGIPIPK